MLLSNKGGPFSMNLGRIIPACTLALLLCGCSNLMFFPLKEHRPNPVLELFSREDIFFRSTDGTNLHGWLFRPAGKSKGTVLVLHGNAENISTHVNGVLWLVKEGFTLFIVDYRGYGRSEGRPTLEGVHADAAAAVEELLRRPEGAEGIAILGQSIGGSIAVATVGSIPRKEKIRALVIDSAPAGFRRMARDRMKLSLLTRPFSLPLAYLLNDEWSAERWIARIAPVPLLILHGNGDTIVPPDHAVILFREASPPREMILTDAGHIASFAEESVRRRTASFIETAFRQVEILSR